MNSVYVRTGDGNIKFFEKASIRMSTHGVLCIVDFRDYNKILHAYPDGMWKEVSSEKLY